MLPSLQLLSKQCLAVGNDDVLPCIVLYLRVFADFEHDVLLFVEHDVLAVVGFHYSWLDMLAAGIGRGFRVHRWPRSHR